MIESDSNAVAGDYLERLAQETDVRSARRALLASDIDAQIDSEIKKITFF